MPQALWRTPNEVTPYEAWHPALRLHRSPHIAGGPTCLDGEVVYVSLGAPGTRLHRHDHRSPGRTPNTLASASGR